MPKKEEWRPVSGYEGIYEISNRARVRSLDRVVRGRGGCARRIKGRVLTQRVSERGYKVVLLYKDNQPKTFKIARGMALAFGVIKPGEEVDHRDRGKTRNKLHNLRPADRCQQLWNQGKRSTNTSGYKGVSWSTSARKWRADIGARGEVFVLGYFDDPQKAHRAYKKAARRLHGGFACFG